MAHDRASDSLWKSHKYGAGCGCVLWIKTLGYGDPVKTPSRELYIRPPAKHLGCLLWAVDDGSGIYLALASLPPMLLRTEAPFSVLNCGQITSSVVARILPVFDKKPLVILPSHKNECNYVAQVQAPLGVYTADHCVPQCVLWITKPIICI